MHSSTEGRDRRNRAQDVRASPFWRQVLGLAMRMHCDRMLRCFVLCIGVRRVLVKRLGGTMLLGPGERQADRHK